jgi:hypothetical protein
MVVIQRFTAAELSPCIYLTHPSVATRGCALARRCIRVLALPKQPSLRFFDSHDSGCLNHPSSTFSVLWQSSISRLDLTLAFKSHSSPRPRQTQRLPPSLLSKTPRDRRFSSTRSVLPEAFPIKASDYLGVGRFGREEQREAWRMEYATSRQHGALSWGGGFCDMIVSFVTPVVKPSSNA